MVSMDQNIAFIDGQNLHLGARDDGWKIDHKKLRAFLKDKYKIGEAYYFPGYLVEEHEQLYTKLRKSGFRLVFKHHNIMQSSEKKGNADALMVFLIMRSLLEDSDKFGRILLITGDGDFYEVVDYLISIDRFEKILHPTKANASSLYKRLGSEKYDILSRKGIKNKLEMTERQIKKEKGS